MNNTEDGEILMIDRVIHFLIGVLIVIFSVCLVFALSSAVVNISASFGYVPSQNYICRNSSIKDSPAFCFNGSGSYSISVNH